MGQEKAIESFLFDWSVFVTAKYVDRGYINV